MISLKENGLSVFPYFTKKEMDAIEAKTGRIIRIIVDIICGNSVAFGQYKKVESAEDLRLTERIFLQTYHKKWESELSEDRIYGIRSYAGNRFISYSSNDSKEQPVTMMSAHTQTPSLEIGTDDTSIPLRSIARSKVAAGLSFFLPASLENVSDEVIYSYFFYWIDAIITFEIAKEVGLEDHIYTGYENPLSIIVDRDISNPNFIKFFVDYYSMIFRIFNDVTDGSLNSEFKCGTAGESDFWWDNLGGFIVNLKDYNSFGLIDPNDFHILTAKDAEIRLNYDKLTTALKVIAANPYEPPYFEVATILVGYDEETIKVVNNMIDDMLHSYHEVKQQEE